MIYGTQAGNYATCTEAGATKTATIPGFVLTTGVHVRLKFTSNNTAAAPTLNVSGTGEKSIKIKGNNLAAAGDLAANGIYEFVYDGTNWELVGAVPTSHAHGNISNTGTLTDTAAAASGNDYVVIRDADNNKIQTSTIKGTDVADVVGSASNNTYTLTNPTTKPVRWLASVLALPLPANKSWGIIVSLIATTGSTATGGKLMVVVYSGNTANTVTSIEACWIERCADIRIDAVQVGCVNTNASASVFILLDLSRCGSRAFNVHFMEDAGVEWGKYSSDGSGSTLAFASFSEAEQTCAGIVGKNAFDLKKLSWDSYCSDARMLDTLSSTVLSQVDEKLKLPDNIICANVNSVRYLKMSQLVNYKSHRFDMWYWSTTDRVLLNNNLGVSVTVFVPGNAGGSCGVYYTILVGENFVLNGAGRAKPTSVWVTRIDTNIYVTYGY